MPYYAKLPVSKSPGKSALIGWGDATVGAGADAGTRWRAAAFDYYGQVLVTAATVTVPNKLLKPQCVSMATVPAAAMP
jgi:hypothetical protein